MYIYYTKCFFLRGKQSLETICLLLAYKIKVGNHLVNDDEDDAAAHGDGDDEHLPALGLQDQSGQSPL